MLDYLDDLESDFSAIHRIDDIYAMDGPRFFRLAYRMTCYEGVMRMRAEDQNDRQHGQAGYDRPASSAPSRQRDSRGPQHVPVAALLASPDTADLFDRTVG